MENQLATIAYNQVVTSPDYVGEIYTYEMYRQYIYKPE